MPEPTDHTWRKSTFSGTGGCVQVLFGDRIVKIRDSKSPSPSVAFTPTEWQAFIQGVKAGEFDNA